MRIVLAALALLLLPIGAQAGTYCARAVDDCSSQWPRCIQRCVRWAQNHTYRLPEHEYPPRVYGYERREAEVERRHCPHPMLRQVGNQHLTQDGAKKAADDSWAADVRFRHGEVYMDLNNARDVSYTCSRSSIKEGGVTTLGQSLTRCEIRGVPCRAPRTQPLPPPEDRDDR